jgi:hypothetical protein
MAPNNVKTMPRRSEFLRGDSARLATASAAAFDDTHIHSIATPDDAVMFDHRWRIATRQRCHYRALRRSLVDGLLRRRRAFRWSGSRRRRNRRDRFRPR